MITVSLQDLSFIDKKFNEIALFFHLYNLKLKRKLWSKSYIRRKKKGITYTVCLCMFQDRAMTFAFLEAGIFYVGQHKILKVQSQTEEDIFV
jgi:hypothetical protein